MTFDCVVRIDLYLHADLLPNCLIEDVSPHLYIADAKFMELGHQPAFASGSQKAPSTSRWFRRRCRWQRAARPGRVRIANDDARAASKEFDHGRRYDDSRRWDAGVRVIHHAHFQVKTSKLAVHLQRKRKPRAVVLPAGHALT